MSRIITRSRHLTSHQFPHQFRNFHTSTHLCKTAPPHRPFTHKLKYLYLRLTKSPLAPLFNDDYYAGSDRFGNEYYEYRDPTTGVMKRLVRMHGVTLYDDFNINNFADQMSKSSTLPMEWRSWLNFVRKETPDPQEQDRLEKERAWRALKAREWDALQMREEIRGGGEVTTPMPSADGAYGFEEYVRTERDKAMQRDVQERQQQDKGRNMFSKMAEDDSHFGRPRGYEQMSLEEARAINEEMRMQNPSGTEEGYVPPHAETNIDSETKRTPSFYPSDRLARDRSLNLDIGSAEEGADAYTKQRHHERQLSMNRTSKFLGVRPGIRPDAARSLRLKERERLAQERDEARKTSNQ